MPPCSRCSATSSYPNVVGSFDRWALPRRAWIGAIDRRGDRLALQVDAQTLTKFERSYKIVREPMRLAPTGEKAQDTVVARWTAIGAGDEVVATGRAQEVEGDRLIVDLRGKLPTGRVPDLARAGAQRTLDEPRGEGDLVPRDRVVDVLFIHLLNSLLYASVLFLIAGGLSLIYGVMRIVNLAHGNIYAFGAYVTAWVIGSVVAGASTPVWLVLPAGGRGRHRDPRRRPRADAAAAVLQARRGISAPLHLRSP